MIFGKELTWDTVTIQGIICDNLKEWDVKTSYGLTDFSENAKSAFIIEATKEKVVLMVYLENEDEQIRIKAGIAGKYLPEGKKVPKYSKVFKSTELKEASDYFEKILEDYK